MRIKVTGSLKEVTNALAIIAQTFDLHMPIPAPFLNRPRMGRQESLVDIDEEFKLVLLASLKGVDDTSENVKELTADENAAIIAEGLKRKEKLERTGRLVRTPDGCKAD